jgi:hypothetical protein
LDAKGQPHDQPPVERRRSELITPVPKPRGQQKKAGANQTRFVLSDPKDLSTIEQEYNPTGSGLIVSLYPDARPVKQRVAFARRPRSSGNSRGHSRE